MFDAETLRAVDAIAARIKVEPAALLAVVEVESGGKDTVLVKGVPEPLIRWEGHYFDARLKNGERERARREGLASPKAGAVKNPASQAARWALVRRAMAINRQAALESFSIGVGQVMTAHWKALGFATVDALIALARRDVAGQIDLMATFIVENQLDDELRRHDFTAFARGYNGKGFRKNRYHLKMAAAYERIAKRPPVSAAAGMLRMGSKGAKVRELQALLTRAGYAVTVDGDFGMATRDAVRAFQKAEKIKADGVAGPETFRRLEAFRQGPQDRPGEVAVKDVPEVREASKGGGLLILVTALRDQIAETAGYVTGVDVGAAQTIANVLLAGSGALGIGLAGWAVYGWWKSRQTDEGDVAAVPEAVAAGEADPVLP